MERPSAREILEEVEEGEPREQVRMMRRVILTNPDFMKTDEFVKWSVRHMDWLESSWVDEIVQEERDNQLTTQEALEFGTEIRKAKAALDAAKTKEDVVKVWNDHYLFLGHRALGRLLVGGDVEAMIAKKSGE